MSINELIWIITNVVIFYDVLALIIFVAGYLIVFDPNSTPVGKHILRFAISMLGLQALILFNMVVGVTEHENSYRYPEGITWWFPPLRLGVYAYIAYSVTSLVILLGLKKWRPAVAESDTKTD